MSMFWLDFIHGSVFLNLFSLTPSLITPSQALQLFFLKDV